MGIYLFHQKISAKCPVYKTIYEYVPILKLDLTKIKFLEKIYMELEFHGVFFFFFFLFLSLIAYESIFAKSSFSFKLDFHIGFFLTSLSNRELKTRVLS